MDLFNALADMAAYPSVYSTSQTESHNHLSATKLLVTVVLNEKAFPGKNVSSIASHARLTSGTPTSLNARNLKSECF